MAVLYESRNSPLESDIASSDSETEGDEYCDKDYDEIRRNIKPILNLGQTLTTLWPISILEQTKDIEDDSSDGLVNIEFLDGPSLSKSLDWPSGSMQDAFFEPKHARAPSLPSHGKLEQIKLQLDEIYLTPDEEYGFNPRRRKSRLGHGTRRSVSLYAPDENADKVLGIGNSSKLASIVLSVSSLQEEKSHARNAEEAKIEEDIACLRAQPSNVEFNRKHKAQKHFDELQRGKLSRKRWSTTRTLRRRLSFDSHLRQRTYSEGAKPSYALYKRNGPKVSVTRMERESFLFRETENEPIFYGSEPILNPQKQEVKLAPPPVLSSKTAVEVLVSGPAEKGKKRRSGIPQFLTALKLPNKKTIKKFMKKKSERHLESSLPSIPHVFPVETYDTDTERVTVDEDSSVGGCQTTKSPSMNTFSRKNRDVGTSDDCKRKGPFSSVSVQAGRISCSLCSLQKLEEGKEMSEFDGGLSRKSCSTCSITCAKIRANSKDDEPVLERRLSDTVLTWKDERQPSCSPGRRFIRRLLSPVVCGIGNDRYMNFQTSESYSSLTSCSSDISIEADLLSQKLTDFDVQEVAEELALIDKELLIRITWQELATCGWMSINKYVTSPNVMNMVEFFNRVAMMVATGILVEETAYLRAKAITKMVKLAVKCHQLKNYNSLRAVLGGLQCTPIYRLEASWKSVRARRKKTFGELSNLMSEDQNFSAYREELKQSLRDSHCLPFLGDFLTQIAQTQAYVAMRRKRSLAKQRLEKASATSCLEKDPCTVSQKEDCSNQCNENEETFVAKYERDICIGHTNLEENNVKKIEKFRKKSRSNDQSENEEKNSDLSFNEEKDEKNTKDFISNFGVDEVDTDTKDVDKEEVGSTEGDDLGDSRMQCEETASSELDGDEYVNLNRRERDRLRRSIHGMTKAMFQNGGRYHTSENDNEILEALNEYIENQSDGEIPVFTDIDAKGREIAAISSSSAIDIQDKQYLCCSSDDYGVGSASSYELSPIMLDPEKTAEEFSAVQGGAIQGDAVQGGTVQDGAEKKTHARNDSNDSGVVLQNGRLSRASEELYGSRENLNTVVSENTYSNALGDSKFAEDTGVPVEEKGEVDRKSCRIIPILDSCDSESKKLEEKIKSGRPIDEETKHKKEVQFWEYQIAAMRYQLTQRPLLRKYLLNACYNSEEENYSLSLKREPIVKK